MPGTTYTRTGPEGDPIGRLADFARFAVEELQAIAEAGHFGHDEGYPLAVTGPRALMLLAASELAVALAGYTTADD